VYRIRLGRGSAIAIRRLGRQRHAQLNKRDSETSAQRHVVIQQPLGLILKLARPGGVSSRSFPFGLARQLTNSPHSWSVYLVTARQPGI
jgi:hypothetical protein